MSESREPDPRDCELCHAEGTPVGPTPVRLRLMPDIAPITPGHLLLVPEEHVYSFAQLATRHPRSVTALRGLLRGLHLRLVHRGYAGTMLFEHGSPDPWRPGVSGKCATTEHAHLHIVPRTTPVPPDVIEEAVLRMLPGSVWLADRASAASHRERGYLWLSRDAGTRGRWLVPASGRVPSQLMRRVICGHLHAGDDLVVRSHWRDFILFREQVARAEAGAARVLAAELAVDLRREDDVRT
ncbi:hypothetical protein [Actinophytocola oryzae]|uniref:HIT domain-containing protein n=1 Tax=Actinophytocola oryzae TaxID=502181 RepID=A0A4R7UV03_9PSEU|nr:hypothetical protein [Actinophytocola oryzae]TDV36826.1 hypothetical protein CLV71_13032 [Actinophytocola oryzae]